ncbi:unnamed protein product [Caenorhabditis nigoni]
MTLPPPIRTVAPPAYLSATGHSRPTLPGEAQLRRRNHSVSSQRTVIAAAPWMSHHLCVIQTPQATFNRRLSALERSSTPFAAVKPKRLNALVQEAKNEKCSEATDPPSSPSRRHPADTKAWTADDPPMSHQLCRIHS